MNGPNLLEPTGTTPFAIWAKRATRWLNRGGIIRKSSTIAPNYSDEGITLDYIGPMGGKGGASAPAAPDFEVYFHADHPDYVVCTAAAGGSGASYNVAKPFLWRNSIASRTIYGVTWTYTYETAGTGVYMSRSADNGAGYTEYQRIGPLLLADDKVFISPITPITLNSVSCPYRLADGREWQKKTDQSTP